MEWEVELDLKWVSLEIYFFVFFLLVVLDLVSVRVVNVEVDEVSLVVVGMWFLEVIFVFVEILNFLCILFIKWVIFVFVFCLLFRINVFWVKFLFYFIVVFV